MDSNGGNMATEEAIERAKSYVIIEEMICREHELVALIDGLCDERQKAAVYAVLRWVGKKYPVVATALALEIYEQIDK